MKAPVARPSVPAKVQASRRYLTILFADLSGSSRLGDAMEAELYGDVLAAVRRACQRVIPSHGGTVVRLQGDGMLAIFGYPEVHEDDVRRATDAALALHRRVRRLRFDPPLPGSAALSLHSGIHAGLVLLDEGDLVRGRFELLGSAPNTAWRLSDAAGPDQILVSEETLGPAAGFFRTGECRQVELKGGAGLLAVRPVLGRLPAGARPKGDNAGRRRTVFVGRVAEIERLEALLDETVGGQPHCVALVAAPGVGKTRLAEQLLQRAVGRGFDVHRGYCDSDPGAEPLQPLLQMLRTLFGLDRGLTTAGTAAAIERRLAELDPALLAQRGEFLRLLSLGRESTPRDASRPSLETTATALCELFTRIAAVRPLLLFVDDWQWADRATVRVLATLRAMLPPCTLLLVATRDIPAGDTALAGAVVLPLAPFTDEEAAETIHRLLPRTDAFVADEVLRYAGGNALFIEELCHSAGSDGSARRVGRLNLGAAWLDVLIESRVTRLPEVQAELVRIAAVIGTVVPAWLLERLTGHAADEPLVRQLAALDFLFPGEQAGTLRFKHAITRDVVYRTIGLHRRRQLHASIAEALRAEAGAAGEVELCEALAYHYGAAGQPREASRYAELAGDKAMAASALDRAQTQYRAALTALDALPAALRDDRHWLSITQRLGLASVFDPSRDHVDVLRRAIALATARDDAAMIARAEYWLGYIGYGIGDSRMAIDHCERALDAAARAGDMPMLVQVRATLGQARAAAGDYDAALTLLDEAIDVKRRHRSGTRPAVGSAYSLACKAAVLGDRGRFDEAHACFGEALEAVRGADHEVEGSVLCWRSGVYLWQGRWDEARGDGERAERIGERVKSFYVYAMGRSLAAYAGWMLEGRPALLQMLADATEWLESRDKHLVISLNHGWLADGLAAGGFWDEARRHAARALARWRRHDRLGAAMACRAIAGAAAQRGDKVLAQRYFELALRVAEARGSPHERAATQLCGARIALLAGDRARAAALVDKAASAFDALGMAWHAEQAGRLLGAAR